MKKIHILLIVILGFILIPGKSFACGNNSEFKSKAAKSCCCSKKGAAASIEIETASKQNKVNCCGEKKNSKSKGQCNGKCGRSKCGPSYSFSGFPISLEINLDYNVFDFSDERQKFYQSETFVSSGFYSIWLIPKIG